MVVNQEHVRTDHTVKEIEIFSSWWTPGVGDIICGLCDKCPGWRYDSSILDPGGRIKTCVAGNPFCG